MIHKRSALSDNGQHGLENRLVFLNLKLVELNERISRLEFQRGRVQLKMQHVVREIHRQQATQVKEELANGRRV